MGQMRLIALLKGLILLALCLSAPAFAQNLVVSDVPEAVSLTVYRATGRGENPINKNWPQGYALITETRTISIPAGTALIRFEGVAEGMFPESAIVTGLPKGVSEKNRDARLLSPSGLVDAYLKRAVTLTRTDRKTGKVRTQDAMIQAGPNGGVILQTADGYEALRCTGLPEKLDYPGLPQNLSAKPTLSVITQSDTPTTAKLTLTYMASGFDWQANYVTQVTKLGADGKDKVDMFAWLTLANGGNQSFSNANVMAIAGEPNRTQRGEQARPTGGALQLNCWGSQTTSDVPYRGGSNGGAYAYDSMALPLPAPPPAPMMMEGIVVTAQMRKSAMPVAAVVAEQEDIGDLKLYRIPESVSVNAKGQKQVAMLVKPDSSFDQVYTGNVANFGDGSTPMSILLRGENSKEKGLGLPMPSGQVMVFEDSDYGPLLAGQATLKDRAVGEKVKIIVGRSSDVRMKATRLEQSGKTQNWKVEISNAFDHSVNAEVEIPYELNGKASGVTKVDGVPTWQGSIPANDTKSFTYSLKMEQ